MENNQEQLNLKRAERVRAAQQTLQFLISKKKEKDSEKESVENKMEHGEEGLHRGTKLIFPLQLENVLHLLEDFKEGKSIPHTYVLLLC